MAEQPNASIAEKNAALRRGTRNRIAKRRPDFVDPFSLRKKRKTKGEGDELLSALSPCSEEGNLKVKLPQSLSNQDSTEKKHHSSSFEGEKTISEVVHSLPTSNPKVRVIIRRKPQPVVPKTVSLKFVPNEEVPREKAVVKLRLRVRPPQAKLDSNLLENLPTCGRRQQADTVPNSSSKVGKSEGEDSPCRALRKSPRNKSPRSKSPLSMSPRKVITKVKLLVSPRPVEKSSSLDNEQNSPDRSQRKVVESSQKPQKKKRNSVRVEALEDSSCTQAPTKALPSIEDDTKHSKVHDAVPEHKRLQAELEPRKHVKGTFNAVDVEQLSTQSSVNGKVKDESKLDSNTSKMDVKLALRENSLPLRKRPYMREERASSSPVLRRSTRNRQRNGYSR